MSNINNTIAKLEHAQICWVIPDIRAAVKFLSNTLGIAFPTPEHIRAQDLNMTYYGEVLPGEWLTTQAYNGTFIELVQPVSGQSMFHDYLARYSARVAFNTTRSVYRLMVSGKLPTIFANKVMRSSAKLIIPLRGWLSSTRTKRWVLLLKSWALHRKVGKPLNKCGRCGEEK